MAGKLTSTTLTINNVDVIPTYTSVTLSSSGWSSNSQTVTAKGVTASNMVMVTSAPGTLDTWQKCKVVCNAQAANSLTFTCTTTPTINLTANIICINREAT